MDCGPIAWQSWAAMLAAADQDFLRRRGKSSTPRTSTTKENLN
jgi:hypothetical protein